MMLPRDDGGGPVTGTAYHQTTNPHPHAQADGGRCAERTCVVETPDGKEVHAQAHTKDGKNPHDPRPDPRLAATTCCSRRNIRLPRGLRRWQICTTLLLIKLMFQIGDALLGVILVHQQMVPPASRAGQEWRMPASTSGRRTSLLNGGSAVDFVGIGSEPPLVYLPRPRLTRRLSGVRLIRVANYRCDGGGGGEY